jgi:hypothetical protein
VEQALGEGRPPKAMPEDYREDLKLFRTLVGAVREGRRG